MDKWPRLLTLFVRRGGLIGLTLALSMPALADEVFYTWTDDDGVRHFSAQPPEDRDYRIVETLNPGATETGETRPTLRQPPPPAALAEISQVDPDPDVVAERCDQARGNLELLQQDRPALLRQDDGETVPMDDATRQDMIEEIRAFIAEWC